MKKIVLCILLLSTLISLFAEDYDYTLQIKAFKPGNQDVEMKINNALTLEDIKGENSSIVLNEYAGKFINNIPSNPTSMVSEVVFSYRIEGADSVETGTSYTLNISMTPFKRVGGPEVIPALFQLGYIDATFPGEANELNVTTRDNWNIEIDSSVLNSNVSTGKGTLSKSWTLNRTEGTNNSSPNWIVRGAVGLILDYQTYQDAKKTPIGKYTSTVTLELVTP